MSTPQPPPGNSSSNPDASYRAILEYLTKRGHHKAALALTQDLGGGGDSPNNSNPASPQPQLAGGGGKSVGLEDFAERNAPSRGTPQPRRRPDQSVAPGQMLADPPSWEKGYNGLRQFVENVKSTLTLTLPLSLLLTNERVYSLWIFIDLNYTHSYSHSSFILTSIWYSSITEMQQIISFNGKFLSHSTLSTFLTTPPNSTLLVV